MLQIADLERLADLVSKHPNSTIASARFFLNELVREFKEDGLFNQDGSSFKDSDKIEFFKILIQKIMESCRNLSQSIVNPSAPFWDSSKEMDSLSTH